MRQLTREPSQVGEHDPIIFTRIGNIGIKALIDTGAQISVITRETIGKIMSEGIEVKSIPIRKVNLRGAFREKGSLINEKVQLEVQMAGRTLTYAFYIVDKMIYPMVIGIDLLNQYQAEIKCKTDGFEVELKGRKPTEDLCKVINAFRIDEGHGELSKILENHPVLFREEIGRALHYEHKIETISDKPFKGHTYPISDKYKE